MCLEIIYLIYVCKKDLTLNNLLWLICHKTKPNLSEISHSKVRVLGMTLNYIYIYQPLHSGRIWHKLNF